MGLTLEGTVFSLDPLDSRCWCQEDALLSRTFNSFVWRSAKIHSTAESRCRPFSSWGFYAFAFKLFLLFFFQGEHGSTIEKNYFCKRKKKVWKGWYERPPLTQAVGDVNSRICPMVHKNFHKTVLLVCTTLGCVSLIHSFLYSKHTLVKKTKRNPCH